MAKKIRIGISSCLLGNAVRYDGGHKLDRGLLETLGRFADWVPVCPEVECGLSVPRDAMILVKDTSSLRLVTIDNRVDHTERMQRWMEKKMLLLEQDNLCGFVFKARSPSCGIRDAQIVSPAGAVLGPGPGLFAARVMLQFPSLPVEDEGRLQDPALREGFLARVAVHRAG